MVPESSAGSCFGCCSAQRQQRMKEGGPLQGELLKAPHNLCASGTWISLEQSFKDWTQFSCLPPAMNRVEESFVFLDCASSPLHTTVFTGSEWSVFKLHAYAGGWELDAVSRSATQLACKHNKQKCFQRYVVGEITALFLRGRDCSRSSVFSVRSCQCTPLESWTSLSQVDITGVMEDSSHVTGNWE